jgi:DNA processing protein
MARADQRRLLTLCAIRVDGESIDWSLLAREATRSEGLDRLYRGELVEKSKAAEESRSILERGLSESLTEAEARVDDELEKAVSVGARLVTVFDEDYPANLRLIPNLPPFLFIRGTVEQNDMRSVAVVGTRNPTEAGVAGAGRMARMLSERGVTVVSGLARGIDTASHRAAIDAGGRTIAVIGTGITRYYPAENKALAEEILGHGALVSQFWPTSSPAKWTFPRRNVVMSGIAQGTVVIEATRTSGAKMQARLALEHRKRVFLVHSLVTNEKWAQDYLKRGAIEVAKVDDVIRYLAAPERIAETTQQRQMTLDLV